MSNTGIFQVAAILDGVTPRKDGGVSLRFVTNEVSKEEKVTLMEFYQSFGWVLFSREELEESNIPKEQATREKGTKSPSQVLRGRLFVYWRDVLNNNPEDSVNFENWYAGILNKIGRQYLDKVEEHNAIGEIPDA